MKDFYNSEATTHSDHVVGGGGSILLYHNLD